MLFQWQTPKNDLIIVGCKHLLAAEYEALEGEEEASSLQSHRRQQRQRCSNWQRR